MTTTTEQDSYEETAAYGGSATHYPRVDSDLDQDDVRLLILPGTSQTADESQWRTDLTSADAGGYETSSARLDLEPERSVQIEFNWDTASSGTLFYNGNTGLTAYAIWIRFNAANGDLEIGNDSTGFTVTFPVPSWITGTAKKHILSVAMEAQADGTGVRIEAVLHDQTAADGANWEIVQTDDWDEGITDANFVTSYGGTWNGANLTNDFTDTIHTVRVCSTFRTTESVYVDFVNEDGDYAGSGQQHIAGVGAPADLADTGQFAGPLLVHGQYGIARHNRRQLSPLIQVETADPPTLEDDLEDCFDDSEGNASPQGVVQAQAGWQVWRGWYWERPIPSMCNFVHVRAHVQLWATAGAPDKIELRAYSGTVPPWLNWLTGEYAITTGNRTTNDGIVGTGGWVELGQLEIVRRDDGWSYFYLATRMNDGAASAATRAKIRAITFEPISTLTDPNVGYGGGGGGGWQQGG